MVRVAPDSLIGRHPATMDIRERTGCSVVAVERGADLFYELGEDFQVREGDQVYLCGSNESTRHFREVFGS